jgi:hypothetical protein
MLNANWVIQMMSQLSLHKALLQILIEVLHPFFRAMGYLGFGKLK